jgi:hypothetical protein
MAISYKRYVIQTKEVQWSFISRQIKKVQIYKDISLSLLFEVDIPRKMLKVGASLPIPKEDLEMVKALDEDGLLKYARESIPHHLMIDVT